jgi:hypothetical protein
MEFYCHYCHDWYETTQSESHFDSIHNQKGVTFKKLQERMAVLGGLMTREEPKPTDETAEAPRKNWLYKDDDDCPNGIFVTNNFQHNMR